MKARDFANQVRVGKVTCDLARYLESIVESSSKEA
jgi:hypothetical protein